MAEGVEGDVTRERVHFANHLRGLAALLVLVTHLLGVFFDQDTVGRALGARPLALARPEWTTWPFSPHYNPGPLAVAIFFLISGFVIPFSLSHLRGGPFLLSRVMRIYPTYWAALALGVAAISVCARPGWMTEELSWIRLLGNALLVNGHLPGAATLDLVNWTLAVEIKFYLLAALMGSALLDRRFWPLAVAALGVLGYLLLFTTLETSLRQVWLLAWLRGFATDLPYLAYMLVGTLFYKHYRGLLSGPTMVAQSALLLGVFFLAWWMSPLRPQFPAVTVNYLYGLAVFGIAYLVRDRFAPQPILDALASISYPLYVVHNLVGLAVLQRLLGAGLTYNQALPLALFLVFCEAFLLHHLVEVPSQQLGKRWATRSGSSLRERPVEMGVSRRSS